MESQYQLATLPISEMACSSMPAKSKTVTPKQWANNREKASTTCGNTTVYLTATVATTATDKDSTEMEIFATRTTANQQNKSKNKTKTLVRLSLHNFLN